MSDPLTRSDLVRYLETLDPAELSQIGVWGHTLNDNLVRALLPALRPPSPLCAGDEPVYWDYPLRKEPVPQVVTSIGEALRVVRLAIPGVEFSVTSEGLSEILSPSLGGVPTASAALYVRHRGEFPWVSAEGRSRTTPLALLAAGLRLADHIAYLDERT